MFTVPTDLRELYLDCGSGTSGLSATLGRRAFPANPVLDGDSQQGLGLSLRLKNGAALHVAALNRWVKYSETGYQAKGITGWQNVDQANDAAGAVFLAAQIADLAIGRRSSIGSKGSWRWSARPWTCRWTCRQRAACGAGTAS